MCVLVNGGKRGYGDLHIQTFQHIYLQSDLLPSYGYFLAPLYRPFLLHHVASQTFGRTNESNGGFFFRGRATPR